MSLAWQTSACEWGVDLRPHRDTGEFSTPPTDPTFLTKQ